MGRKPTPCPNYDELRRLHADGFGPTEIADRIGGGYKAVVRWLGEVGIVYRAKPARPSGLPYVIVATRVSDGKRIQPKLYNVWHAMRSRCRCPTNKDYPRYGARGINVDAAWESYDDFRAWAIAKGYRKGLTLDREDSNGNYGPNNCRWLSKSLQQDNTRWVNHLTVDGVTRPLPEWARITGMKSNIINGRLRLGWTHEQAVKTPPGVGRGLPRKPRRRRVLQPSSVSSGQ